MQLPVVGVKALQPRGLSANIQDRGQAKEPECRRLGPPWWTQSCWCRSPGSLRQDDGGRTQRLRSASSKSPLGQETQAEVAHAHNRIFLLATTPLGSVERGPRRRPPSPCATSDRRKLLQPADSRKLGVLELRSKSREPPMA